MRINRGPGDSVSKQRPNIQTRLNSDHRYLFARLEGPYTKQPLDWRFDQDNNPTATSIISASWTKSDWKHAWHAVLAPFEVREYFTNTAPIDFGDVTVPANTEHQSTYAAYEIRLRYIATGCSAADAIPSRWEDHWHTWTRTSNSRRTTQCPRHRQPRSNRVSVSVTRLRWLVVADLWGWSDSDVRFVDFEVHGVFRIDNNWALSAGYRLVDREIDFGEMYNKSERDQILLGVWYAW